MAKRSMTLAMVALIAACFFQPFNLWAQLEATDRHIHAAETHLRMFPNDPGGFDQLGATYLQKGRETGDSSYYELAKKSFQKSLDLHGTDVRAATPALYMSVVMMAEHRFEDALSWAQRSLSFGLGDPSPWAIVGDALADLGEYDRAAEAYQKLSVAGDVSSVKTELRQRLAYEHDSRMSYLKFISGDPKAAIQLMQSAIAIARENRQPAENIAWNYFQLGDEFFQAGDLANAEDSYQQALKIYQNYYRALAGLAKVRAAQQRYSEAAQLYEQSLRVIPVAEYAANLGDVYTKLGRSADAKKQFDLVEFTAYLTSLNLSLNNRELAQYYADHDIKLEQALEFAKKELEVRHDVYTWDVLAWALYKNGDCRQAADAMSHALAQGTKDAMFLFHAGMIYARLGWSEKAKEQLNKAISLNPHFHLVYADLARTTLAHLGSAETNAARMETIHEQ